MNLTIRSSSSRTNTLGRFIALSAFLFFSHSSSLVASTGISLVQHRSKDGGTNTTASVAFSSPNTAGNLIAVAIRGGLSSSQVFTVKDSSGNIYKKAAQIGFTVSAVTADVYYAENIKGGANTITVSMSVSAPLRFAILEYSGVATSSSLDATAVATGVGTAVNSGNATTTVNGDLLFGSASTADGASYTAGTGYTIRDSVPSGNGAKFITEDGIQTTAGTASATATLASSGTWGCVFAAFKPAGGVASPSISSLNPTSAPVGTSVTITGANFGASQGTSTVRFNGTAATPTNWSNTSIAVSVPNGATTGNVVVTVGGLASNGALFTVIVPPSITNLSPTLAPLGTSVTISGSNFGASQGTSTVGTSSAGTGFAFQVINQASKQIAFDTASQRFYLSVPNSAATGNTIAVLDPTTASIIGQQFAGSNPNAIAISDDGQYLYAGIDGSSSVQRFQLPGLATDISYSLGAGPYPRGPFFALDLQVAPGSPHTTAVTRGAFNSGPAAIGGIEIFDDALARPVIAKGFGSGGGGSALYDSLQWGADASVLFASNTEDSLFDFYTLSVTASGISQTTDKMNAFSSFRDKIHFDQGTQLIYADDGQVLYPSTGAPVGTFSVPGPPVMVPDSSLNLAFFAIQTGSSSVGIYSFNLSTFAPVSSITIPNMNGNPVRLIRWGQNGLAFNTDAGQIVLVGGNFVH